MRRCIPGVLILAGALTSACADPQIAAQARPPVSVVTAAARTLDAHGRLQAGGVIAARQTATLSSRVQAPVSAVHVQAGERVRAGQPLVRLDAAELTAHADQAVATVAAAEQALPAARADVDAAQSDLTLAAAWQTRISALHARNSATTQERDEAEARLAAANARLASAQARVAQATAALGASRAASTAAATVRGFTTVTAPFDGVVARRFVDPGALALPGTPLILLDAVGPTKVLLLVDESRVAFLPTGTRVSVEIGRTAESAAVPAGGTVTQVARHGDANGRTFAVDVALPAGITAPPGTFARVTFPGEPRTVLLIPADAVVRRGQVTSVFVVADGIARLRLVHTGELLEDAIEILAGLAAGDVVVRTPAATLTDGHPVTAGTAPPAGARR